MGAEEPEMETVVVTRGVKVGRRWGEIDADRHRWGEIGTDGRERDGSWRSNQGK